MSFVALIKAFDQLLLRFQGFIDVLNFLNRLFKLNEELSSFRNNLSLLLLFIQFLIHHGLSQYLIIALLVQIINYILAKFIHGKIIN